MNEVGAKKAVQNILHNNESDIFLGIIQYGVQRKFQHVTRSTLTPATGYYYVGIQATNKTKRVLLDPFNDVLKVKIPQYSINITIVDYLGSVTGESELFESMTDDFNLVTDRIMELIDPDDSDIITYFYDDNNHRFRLVEDSIPVCENTPSYFPDAEENLHGSMMAEIVFEIEEC